jgi:hypothetical protein
MERARGQSDSPSHLKTGPIRDTIAPPSLPVIAILTGSAALAALFFAWRAFPLAPSLVPDHL